MSIVFTLLFLLFLSQNDQIFAKLLEGTLFNAQLGIIVGISVNGWLQVKTDPQFENTKALWDRFIYLLQISGKFAFWLLFGGLGLPIIYLIIFNINKNNYYFLYFILHFSAIFGIINSGGDNLIKSIRFKAKAREIWPRPRPKITWKKFVLGLLIGILYSLPATIFTLITDPLLGYDINNILYDLLQNIDFSILVGLIIGSVYGFGPLILFTIDNLQERFLGRIGVVIMLLGGIIAIFPH